MSAEGGPNMVYDGLVLYLDAANLNSYPGSGTIWSDLTTNVNTGTLTNGPTFNTGSGGSIVFDGTNDYASCGNISSLILSQNQFTLSYWFKMTGTARGDLFCIKNFNTPQDDIGFFIDTDNKIYAYFKVQGTVTNNYLALASVSTAALSRNVIYNVTCMKDASQKIVMYINGILDNNTYSTTTNTSTVATTPFWIASNKTNITTPESPFAGNIYSVQIYNRGLSATEVLQNYNAQRSRFNL